jgi:hypothetical protein
MARSDQAPPPRATLVGTGIRRLYQWLKSIVSLPHIVDVYVLDVSQEKGAAVSRGAFFPGAARLQAAALTQG